MLKVTINNIFLILFFLIIGINTGSSTCYLLLFIIIILFILRTSKFFIKVKLLDFVAGSFLLLWLYGLILGFAYGNKVSYIIANNAGMVLYILYYILLQIRISREKIYHLLLIAGLSNSIITILLFVLSIIGIPPESTKVILGEAIGGASTGQRRIYFISQIALYCPMAVYMTAFIASTYQKVELFGMRGLRDNVKVFFAFLFYTICVLLLTASKGFMLGYIFILLILPFSIFFKGISQGLVNKKIIFLILLIPILLGLLLSLGYFNILTAIFDSNDDANVARYEQLYYLLQDLTFWGKGLGAVIPGYARNADKPYGFELSYLALWHKFGIFSLIAIVSYLVTIKTAISNIMSGKNAKYAIISLGSMCYLLPSIGNPLLFAPQAVTLHCMALYLLRND